MARKFSVAALFGVALLALPLQVLAHPDRSHDWHDRADRWQRQDRLVDKYDHFAGSEGNARELVHGLRNDTQIKLRKDGQTTKFTPATDKMGWGNVDHALALAKASLAEHGIRHPTPEQIKAALNGGTITTPSGKPVTLSGVLALRARGMGWGEIAHKLGFKLGDLKQLGDLKRDDRLGHDKHDRDHDGKDRRADGKHERKHDWKHHHRHDGKHERADWKRHDRHDFHRAKFHRPERHDKFERPHRPDKFERPQRPERPEKHHYRH